MLPLFADERVSALAWWADVSLNRRRSLKHAQRYPNVSPFHLFLKVRFIQISLSDQTLNLQRFFVLRRTRANC
jgi:hypothetical protein